MDGTLKLVDDPTSMPTHSPAKSPRSQHEYPAGCMLLLCMRGPTCCCLYQFQALVQTMPVRVVGIWSLGQGAGPAASPHLGYCHAQDQSSQGPAPLHVEVVQEVHQQQACTPGKLHVRGMTRRDQHMSG